MQTLVEILWVVVVLLGVAGMCLGVARVIQSGYLFLTARGDAEQIKDAKSMLWHSIMGMMVIAGTFVINALMYLD